MPNITLSLPDKAFAKMKKFNEIRWSEIVRRAVIDKIEELSAIEKIASKSKLTMEDVMELDKKIKKGIRKHFDSLK
ncbi:MAG: hypothetical protein AABX11_04115 [Nanoarchaeota archaeon]